MAHDDRYPDDQGPDDGDRWDDPARRADGGAGRSWDDNVDELQALLDRLGDEDRYDEGTFYRTCGRCGTRTPPRWSEGACLEEARRYGWRRVAASDRPGARRMDLCGSCAAETGVGPPIARFGW